MNGFNNRFNELLEAENGLSIHDDDLEQVIEFDEHFIHFLLDGIKTYTLRKSDKDGFVFYYRGRKFRIHLCEVLTHDYFMSKYSGHFHSFGFYSFEGFLSYYDTYFAESPRDLYYLHKIIEDGIK